MMRAARKIAIGFYKRATKPLERHEVLHISARDLPQTRSRYLHQICRRGNLKCTLCRQSPVTGASNLAPPHRSLGILQGCWALALGCTFEGEKSTISTRDFTLQCILI